MNLTVTIKAEEREVLRDLADRWGISVSKVVALLAKDAATRSLRLVVTDA